MLSPAKQATQLLRKHWDGRLAVDLDALAKKIGVNVIYEGGVDGDWDVSGKFFYDAKGNPTCVINMYDISQRQRFTLAHELGHYYLNHGEQIDSTESLYRRSGYQAPMEREANAFAAELIMPKMAIDYFIQEKGMTSLAALAQKFDVSEVAMRYRLKNTGWL